MHHIFKLMLVALALAAPSIAVDSLDQRFNAKPFKIDLSSKVQRMKERVKDTELPVKPEYLGASTVGIQLNYLHTLKDEWIDQFDWDAEQKTFNSFKQFKVTIEGIDLHFIHEKSKFKDSIPILLLHGWPVPSLPGFTFSSAPPANWTIDDTGRIFNTLMTEVLGYPKYALHGTDWGSAIGWSMYNSFNSTVRATHLTFIPFYGPTPQEAAEANITLSPIGEVGVQRSVEYRTNHSAYFAEQTTQPNTIGLALYGSPVGQLAWIGDIYQWMSDPHAGTAPSVLSHMSILTAVSLYYLTDSFMSAEYIYAQNPGILKSVYQKATTDAPLLFSNFKYNVMYWPAQYLKKATGNLVYFKDHDFGGHFAGLDNPPALIEDIRQIGDHFEKN